MSLTALPTHPTFIAAYRQQWTKANSPGIRSPCRTRQLRRRTLPQLVAIALAVMVAAFVASSTGASPLNVVIILADDLGAHDLGCMGSTFHETPHLDRLAAEGMRFTQAYSSCTVCSPTRAALATGRYPARLRITDWIKGHDFPKAKLRPPEWITHLPLEEVTLAERLKVLPGLRTGHLGKWHLGGEGFEPKHQGFDINLGGDHRGQPPSYFTPYGLPQLPDGRIGEYLTDREAAEAVGFIAAHAERPFFLSYCPHAVHTPLQAPEEIVAKYAAKAWRTPGAQSNATYAAMLERLDTAAGRILQALDENHLGDRTLVIFTSDNGGLVLGNSPPTSNAPLRSGKGSPYEGGVRVPLLVKWPGVTRPGSISAEPVQAIDLVPTVLDAVGLSTNTGPVVMDGRSLTPLLRDPVSTLGREALFWHYPHYHPGGATPYAAIRAGDWKLIQYYENGRHELFNLRDDPAESRDLAGAQPDRVLGLARKLFAWQGAVGAQWPRPNPGWESRPLFARTDGSVLLHSRDAFVNGEVLRYEPQPFKDTLGWWSNSADWAGWSFEVSRAGRYEMTILQGCGNGSGGSEVEFRLGDSRRVVTVIETGGFQNFANRVVGEFELSAGVQTLEVRPLRKPGPAVMDLRQVILTPVPPSR